MNRPCRIVLGFTIVMAISAAFAAPTFSELCLEDEATLETRLEQASGRNRGRVLVALAALVMERDPEQTLQMLDDASGLLDDRHDAIPFVHMETTRCWALYQLTRTEESAAACKLALELAEAAEERDALPRTYNAISVIALSDGRVADAIDGFRRAARIALEVSEYRQAASSLNNLGLALRQRGLYEQALESFSRGLDVAKLADDNVVDRVLDFNVGLTHTDLGNYDVAREHYRRALDWARESDNPRKELTALIYLAKADSESGQGIAGIRSLAEAITNERFAFDAAHLAEAHATLGIAYRERGRLDESLAIFERGFELARQAHSDVRIRELSLGYAGALTDSGRLAEADALLAGLIPGLRADGLVEPLIDALRRRAETAAARGDFERAYHDRNEAEELSAGARSREFKDKLTLLSVDHAVESKDRELQLARERETSALARHERARAIRNAMIGVFVLLAVVGYLFHSRRIQTRIAASERAANVRLEGLVAERTRALEAEMTERARSDERRLQVEQQLAEADKLRALGQLTGGIAHDFNNLLTVITFGADLLKDRISPADREGAQLLEEIGTATRSGAQVTSRLLAYARKQPLRPEPVELREFLRETLPLIQRTVGAAVSVSTELDPRERRTTVDRGQLTTALLNLAFNAREAMDGRGSLVIRSGIRDIRAGEANSLPADMREGRYVTLTVSDDGRGMGPDEVARACEPFYSTKPTAEGGGLGLSMVYGFTRQSGGDLKIESLRGEGTSVTLLFPLRHARASAVEAIGEPLVWKAPTAKRLLLVEDEAELCLVTSKVLTSLGFDVETAADGAEAQRRLSQPDPPDLMIVDVVMAGAANGYDVAEFAQQRWPEIPIVMTSGYVESHDARYPFLRKPYSIEELKNCLSGVLGTDFPPGPRSSERSGTSRPVPRRAKPEDPQPPH